MVKETRFSPTNSGGTISLVVTLMAWLMTGCAGVPVGGSSLYQTNERAMARDVFIEAIEGLDDRHIKPIVAGKIMMTGLEQLSSIDSRLTVTRTARSVILKQDDKSVFERPAPAINDIDEWSLLGADFLEEAKRVSPELVSYSREELLTTIFGGLLHGLDRYSRYVAPANARNSRASREGFGGIGIEIDRVDGDFIVKATFPDCPAIFAGLLPNDRITHVDGHPIHGLPISDVVTRLRGPVGEPVKITISRANAPKPLVRHIIRDLIIPSTVEIDRRDGLIEVRLSGFNTGTVGQLRRGIEKAEQEIGESLKGLVLDMRGNPGGLLDQAIAVSDLFITRGRIISTNGRHPDSNQLFDATPQEIIPGVPMVVVVNGRSASAAEIVAVALRDSGRAAIVGSTSFGKGSVQTIISLPNDADLNITWARIFAPSGQTLDTQGIVPAICTNVSEEQLKSVLEALESREKISALEPMTLHNRARQPHFSAESRKACMPTDRKGKDDLRAARLLLTNQVSYAAATSRPGPVVAKRLPDGNR